MTTITRSIRDQRVAASTSNPPPRSLSANARPTGGAVRLLRAQIAAELRGNLRVPEYIIGVVAVPVILYVMFGLPNAGRLLPGGTDIGAMQVVSMSCYGVVSLAIFTFGVDAAQERGEGWLRRLRATPMPMWAYFAAKIVMALVFTLLIVVLTTAVAVLLGHITVDLARLAASVGLLLLGTVAFSTAGFALAYWARSKAASAIGNLIFLPLSFLSGFFYPVTALPSMLQGIAPWLPTYHFGQLVWGQVAPTADVIAYGSPEPGPLWVHLAWVLASFVGFGALAVAGYRRDAQRERQ